MNLIKYYYAADPNYNDKMFFIFSPLYIEDGYLHFIRSRYLVEEGKTKLLMKAHLMSPWEEFDRQDFLKNTFPIGKNFTLDNPSKAEMLLLGYSIPDLSFLTEKMFDISEGTKFVTEDDFCNERDDDVISWIEKYGESGADIDDFEAHMEKVYL